MQVTCPACSTRYTTDDAKVRGKTVRMRCRACDTVWLVSGPSHETREEDAREVERLFEGFAEPPREEKRAAVVKRGAEREKRDLFAFQGADEGYVKQTLRPPPPGYGFSGVGARSEDSVLFTVDSLRAAAKVETPAPVRATREQKKKEDEEGVIDLKALSARPPAVAAAPLATFGSEPPGGFARSVAASAGFSALPPPKKSRGAFAAGVATLAAMGLAVASAVVLFGGDIPHRASRSAASVVPRAAAVGAKAHEIETAKAEAERKAAEKAAEATAKEDAKRPGKGGKTVRWGAARGGVSSAPRASAPPKPSAPVDACGCHGNFDCVIRCSAKGK